MRKIFIYILVLLINHDIWGQTIIVLNPNDTPIPRVMIREKKFNITVFTDENGKADISDFKNSHKIEFNHEEYEVINYTYKQLEEMEFSVILNRKKVSLNEVVISANRWEQKKMDSPSRIEAINMREAAFQNPQTTADLLGMSGFAFIQKSQLGGGSPMIRGMATNRLLIVVDGVRMNTAIFRSGNLQNIISLDANAMESAEILMGAGSVMYGSDAVGGVMNFQTFVPQFLDSSSTQKLVMKGNAFSRFSTANQEKTQHIDLHLRMKKWSFISNFTYADYGDLRSGTQNGHSDYYKRDYVIRVDNQDVMVKNQDSTLQVGSQYDQVNFMQKIAFRPSQYWNLEYAFHFSETSPYNRYDRLYVYSEDKLRWAEWYYGPQKWQMHRIGVKYQKNHTLFNHLKIIGAYQFFEESRYDRRFMSNMLNGQKENVFAYSLNLDFEKFLNNKITIHYGWETVYNLVRSYANEKNIQTGEELPTVTRYPDGSKWLSNGIYAKGSYRLNLTWILHAGVRYNPFYIYSPFDTSLFPYPYTFARLSTKGLSGQVGVVANILPQWNFSLLLSNGFRSPNVDDWGKVFESVPGYLVVPNPNLKPEKVYNVEIGTNKIFKNWLKVSLSTYYTWLFDAMVRKNYALNGDTTMFYQGSWSRIQAIQNVTQIQVYGFQVSLEASYKSWGIKSSFSYQKGKEQAEDSLVYYPLRHAAPAFGITHFTYERLKFKWDFYLVYNARMNYEDLALTERDNPSYARDSKGLPFVPSWYTLNFKMGYYPNQHIGITLGVENILDKMYRPYSSGINAPGRNIITCIRVSW